jgi:hypothetical protein
MTTGGKPRLLWISKRGNGYLRKMLIHGARAALPTLSKGQTILGGWLRNLLVRAHINKVIVALAAKMARIIWSVLRNGIAFKAVTMGVPAESRMVTDGPNHRTSKTVECLWVDEKRWPTVERHFENLIKKMAKIAVMLMRIEMRGAPSWPG